MNATKFVVLLVIGVLCANVSASVIKDESKETKLGVSNPKTTTKGVGAELSVDAYTSSYNSDQGSASATKRPASATGVGNGYTSTYGSVRADGPKAQASSTSGSSGQGQAAATASRNGAAANGSGSAGSESSANGRTGKVKSVK